MTRNPKNDQLERGSRTVTSECVADGHPDKLCDQIVDAVLDACLEQDATSRVALEAAFKDHDLFLFGELSSDAEVDIDDVVRATLRRIFPRYDLFGLDLDALGIRRAITRQAGEIAAKVGAGDELGAGDQGIAYGYACDETPAFMPLAYALARDLMRRHREIRLTGEDPVLGPDAKAQVTVRYEDGRPVAVEHVVVSSQHRGDVAIEAVRRLLADEIVAAVIPPDLTTEDTVVHLNPGGPFTQGGPIADAGLTGRKLVADTYGCGVPHGGGAFSGKDGTKVDRSGAYMARAVARHIVATGRASRALVHAAWAIGEPEPLAVEVDTFGTGSEPDAVLALRFASCFRPATMIRTLGLTRPIFGATAAFGHFGRAGFPWERPLIVTGATPVILGAHEA